MARPEATRAWHTPASLPILVPPPIPTPQIGSCWGLSLLLLAFPVGDSLSTLHPASVLLHGSSALLQQDPRSWDLLPAGNLGQDATSRKNIYILNFSFKWGLSGGIKPFERNSKNHDKCWSHPRKMNDHPGTSYCTHGPFGSSDSSRLRLWLHPCCSGQEDKPPQQVGSGEKVGDSGVRATLVPPAEELPANPLQGMPAGPIHEEPQMWAFEVNFKCSYTHNHRQIDRIKRRPSLHTPIVRPLTGPHCLKWAIN